MKWPLLDVPGSAGLKDSRSPTPGHLVSFTHSKQNFDYDKMNAKMQERLCVAKATWLVAGGEKKKSKFHTPNNCVNTSSPTTLPQLFYATNKMFPLGH